MLWSHFGVTPFKLEVSVFLGDSVDMQKYIFSVKRQKTQFNHESHFRALKITSTLNPHRKGRAAREVGVMMVYVALDTICTAAF